MVHLIGCKLQIWLDLPHLPELRLGICGENSRRQNNTISNLPITSVVIPFLSAVYNDRKLGAKNCKDLEPEGLLGKGFEEQASLLSPDHKMLFHRKV